MLIGVAANAATLSEDLDRSAIVVTPQALRLGVCAEKSCPGLPTMIEIEIVTDLVPDPFLVTK